MKFYGKVCGDYELTKGDFLLRPDMSDRINAATIIFVNNFAFGPQVDHQLKIRFANMKEHARIVSSRAFCSLNFHITERNLSDIGSILDVEELLTLPSAVSWTDKPFTYYIHTINRSLLEDYFKKLKNPELKTASDRIARYDRRMKLNGTYNKSSAGVEQHLKNGIYQHGASVGVCGSSSSSGVVSDVSEAASETNGGSPEHCSFRGSSTRHCKIVDNKSDTMSFDWDELSSGDSPRVALTPCDDVFQPHNRRPKVQNKPKKKPRKVRLLKAGRPRMSAATMQALDLFHDRAVAMSNTPADVKASESLNDKRMSGVADARSRQCNKLLSTSSCDAVVSSPHLSPAAVACRLLPASDDDIPGLQQLLDSVKTMYVQFVRRMATDNYRQDVENEIRAETARREILSRRVDRLETEISGLLQSGVDHLHSRLDEIGIEASCPMEFLDEAKTIVQVHSTLKGHAISLQQTVYQLETQQCVLPPAPLALLRVGSAAGKYHECELPSFNEFLHDKGIHYDPIPLNPPSTSTAWQPAAAGPKPRGRKRKQPQAAARTFSPKKSAAAVSRQKNSTFDDGVVVLPVKREKPPTRAVVKNGGDRLEDDFVSAKSSTSALGENGCQIQTFADCVGACITRALLEDNNSEDSCPLPPSSSLFASIFNKSNTARLNGSIDAHLKQSRGKADLNGTNATPPELKLEPKTVCSPSPQTKRRLFNAGVPMNLSSSAVKLESGRSVFKSASDKSNGFHPLRRSLPESQTDCEIRKGLYGQYDDGLLAMANAACLVSDSVRPTSAPLKLLRTEVGRDGTAADVLVKSPRGRSGVNRDSFPVVEKCRFAALVGYASSQLSDSISPWTEQSDGTEDLIRCKANGLLLNPPSLAAANFAPWDNEAVA